MQQSFVIRWLFEDRYNLLESIILHSQLVPSGQLFAQHSNTYHALVVSVVLVLNG